MWMTDVVCTYQLTHAPSGEYRLFRVAGRRSNDKDKSIKQAISSAFTTFLPELLNVQAGEVDENHPPAAKGARGSRGEPKGANRNRQEPTGAQGNRQEPRGQPVKAGGAVGSKGFAKNLEPAGGWVCQATGEIVPPCSACRGPVVEGKCIRPDCKGEASYPAAGSTPSNEGAKHATTPQDDRQAVAKKALQLAEEKARYQSLLRGGEGARPIEPWLETALIRALDEVPNDFATWKLEHYQKVIQLFQNKGAAVVLSAAVAKMARLEPLDRELADAMLERAQALSAGLFLRAQTAVASGWKHAVDEILDVVAHDELMRQDVQT